MDKSFGQAFAEMIGPIYPVIVYIVFPTAFTLSAICLFTMMFIQNEKAAEAAKDWLKRIIIGTVVILLLGTFATVLAWIINGLFNTGEQIPMPK